MIAIDAGRAARLERCADNQSLADDRHTDTKEVHGVRALHRFLDRLFDDVIPTLCRFPQSGRSLLTRAVRSAKAAARAKELRKLLTKGDDLREFVMDYYLVLYLWPRPSDLSRSPTFLDRMRSS